MAHKDGSSCDDTPLHVLSFLYTIRSFILVNMFLSFDHRLLGRDATTAADSLDESLDNIYTDSNDNGATVHGQSVHFGPSLKDKIIACE